MILVLAGLGGMGVGLALLLTTPPPTAWIDSTGYHLGGAVLRNQGEGVFGDATHGVVVIERAGNGTLRAGASLTYAGDQVTGSCVLRGAAEHCDLHLPTGTIEAQDRLEGSGSSLRWDRRYSDGHAATIVMPSGSAVPVPVPVGR
jgi:hypothetical protein